MLYAIQVQLDPNTTTSLRTMYGDSRYFYAGTVRFIYGTSYGPVHWIDGLDTIHFVDNVAPPAGVPYPTLVYVSLFPGVKLLNPILPFYSVIDGTPGILAGISLIAPGGGFKW